MLLQLQEDSPRQGWLGWGDDVGGVGKRLARNEGRVEEIAINVVVLEDVGLRDNG